MKTFQSLVLALCAMFLVSCVGGGVPPVRVPGGTLVFGAQQQGGGYNPYQQQQGGYFPPQQQQHVVSERCYVKLGADAPLNVVQAVEFATAAKVQAVFAERCFANNGMRGEWPALEEVNQMAQALFKSKGLNLSPGSEGTSGCFKIMEYRPGLPPA